MNSGTSLHSISQGCWVWPEPYLGARPKNIHPNLQFCIMIWAATCCVRLDPAQVCAPKQTLFKLTWIYLIVKKKNVGRQWHEVGMENMVGGAGPVDRQWVRPGLRPSTSSQLVIFASTRSVHCKEETHKRPPTFHFYYYGDGMIWKS